MMQIRTNRIVCLVLACAALSGLPACAQTAPGTGPKPGTSLLKNPNPPALPAFGWWNQGGVSAKDPKAAQSKATWDYTQEGGQWVCKLVTTDPGAGPSFNAYTGDLTGVPAGTMVKLAYQISGNLTQPKPNNRPDVVSTISIFGKAGPSHDIVFTPSSTGAPVVSKPGPLSGQFGPLSVSVVFALPANTTQIKVLNTLTNAVGDIEIKGLSLTVAQPTEASNVPAVANFLTPEQANAAALEKYTANWADWQKKLSIPAADAIYKPKAALAGPHPRYLLGAMPVSQIKERLNNPALAVYKRDLFAQADKFAASVPPKPRMDQEDPLRDISDELPWVALAYLTTDDPAKKKTYMTGAVNLINAETSWGLPTHDLPLSQMILGMGATYDWLYSDLPADAKAKTRQYLIDAARFMRSPENASAWQWRSGENWLANHKWFNYAALMMASSVLWGDAASPLQPGEQKLWMDESMQVFWAVRKTFGPDGAPIEGYNYQEYGLRPYLDFATLADQLTDSTVSFVDMPGIRNIGVSRLHSLLPQKAGFLTYADSYPQAWGSSLSFRFVASRFHDPKAQLLADIMDTREGVTADLNDNYDQKLPDYKTVLASHSAGAATGTPILLEASKYTIVGNGKVAPKVGALHGNGLVSGDPAGTHVSTTFTVPTAGFYTILAKYASGADAVRSLLLDDKIPFREASYIPFVSSGGWATDKNQWRVIFLGAEVPKVEQPWRVYLSAGPHTLTLSNDAGGGLNLDWLAFVPAEMSKADALAKIGDPDPGNPPAVGAVVHNWHGLFWYDPSVPAASWSDLTLYRDNDDLGLYTARSSWTAPNATLLGFKAGPAAGKSVLNTFGLLVSGHIAPDEGFVEFYSGPHAVLAAPGYANPARLTKDYSVTVLEGADKRSAGQLIGQYGEGGEWFSNNWKYIRSNPTTLRADHKPGYDTYLAELAGVYQPTAGNNKASREMNLPTSYRRSVTYLRSGVVVIVDKLEAPTPQTFDFRLLTEAKDMAQSGKAFDFTIFGTPGRIVDFSPQPTELVMTKEKVNAFANPGNDPTTRNVATLKVANQPKAIFAAVLGMNGAEKGIAVQASDQEIVITGAPGGPIHLSWMSQAQPIAADPSHPQTASAK